jgi:hypothetical protein
MKALIVALTLMMAISAYADDSDRIRELEESVKELESQLETKPEPRGHRLPISELTGSQFSYVNKVNTIESMCENGTLPQDDVDCRWLAKQPEDKIIKARKRAHEKELNKIRKAECDAVRKENRKKWFGKKKPLPTHCK